MIRTEPEYRRALAYLKREAEAMSAQRTYLQKMGIDGEGLERAMQPIESFHQQLVEEIQEYDRIKPV